MALLLHLHARNRQRINRRILRDRNNPLDSHTDASIIQNYRLDRASIFEICQEFSAELERSTNRSRSLPVSLQVMIALRYFASGSYMSVIGDAHGVGKMSVSRSIHQISACLAWCASDHIKFPMSAQEQRKVKLDFYDIHHFPHVLGAVDGTLIPIKAPSVDEHLYVSRKGYHAMNIQCICDANNLFTNVVARWPGSTHDSHIWNNCLLSEEFESGRIADGWLLGDSGYGLKPWLLTPKLAPSTRADRRYNAAHKSTRCVIERTYGIWKMRFRCLYKGLTLSPERCIDVILATAVLHNICVKKRIPLDDQEDFDEPTDNMGEHPQDTENGRQTRENLISNVFN